MSFGLNEHRSPYNVGFGYALNGTGKSCRYKIGIPVIGRSFIIIGGLIGISSRHIVGLFHVIPVEVHRRPQRQHQCPQYNMALFDGKYHLAMHSFL